MLKLIAAAGDVAAAETGDPWSGLAGQGAVTAVVLGGYKLATLFLGYLSERRGKNAAARKEEAAADLAGVQALEKVPAVLFESLIEPLRRQLDAANADIERLGERIQQLQNLIHDHEPWDAERMREATLDGRVIPKPPTLRLPPQVPPQRKPTAPGQ